MVPRGALVFKICEIIRKFILSNKLVCKICLRKPCELIVYCGISKRYPLGSYSLASLDMFMYWTELERYC